MIFLYQIQLYGKRKEMFFKKYFTMVTFAISFFTLINTAVIGQSKTEQTTSKGGKNFRWPEGKRVAISLSVRLQNILDTFALKLRYRFYFIK